ncbi:hypothetical protein KP78_13690 [Jeotgalibacillus soli]|uniref:Uncharacterized protein n=1 Tax=Jeotgalibacillus soli TaxID=889306 RepID=A0A0C2VZV8_9BACL|nr:hypothetical protein KP78_13690 [Jeotgalibacillus soli]
MIQPLKGNNHYSKGNQIDFTDSKQNPPQTYGQTWAFIKIPMLFP